MTVKAKWYGKEWDASVHAEMKQRLGRAVGEMARYARQHMSRKTNRDGSSPSSPGDFPAQVTGHGFGNISSEVQGLLGRWGTNVLYLKFLQLGTKNHPVKVKNKKVLANAKTGQFFGKEVEVSMKPRPWMSLTNRAMFDRVTKILSAPMKSFRMGPRGL